jgi:copper transport protein
MLLVLALALGLLGGSTGALAHASLISSDPMDGAMLAAPPAAVVLHFDEDVDLIQFRLLGPGGVEVAPLEPPRLEGSLLRARYSAGMPPGAYLLSYRVTSADGHPIAGAIVFGIGLISGPAIGTTAVPDPRKVGLWLLPSFVARWLFYLTVAIAAGGSLFRLLVAELPDRLRRPLLLIALAGAGLATLQIGLRGALLADAPRDALFGVAVWRLGATTTFAFSLLVAALGLLGCAISLSGSGRRWRALGGLSALLVLASFPLTGHAASAAPQWLTAPALALHAAAAVFWIGAFWPLRVLLKGEVAEAAPVVHRFSSRAVPAVVLLAAMGGILALVQVARAAALIDTRYGLLVSAKLLAFVVLLGIAGWNRQRLTPTLTTHGAYAIARLWLMIGAEFLLATAILAITAVLTLTAPPRRSAGVGQAEHSAHPSHGYAPGGVRAMAQGQGVAAQIEVSPALAGRNTIRVKLNRGSGEPPPREVGLELSLPEHGTAPIRRLLVRDASGYWVHEGLEFSIRGRWTARIEILLGDFDQVALSTTIIIQ